MLAKKTFKILNHWIKKNTTIEADILSIKKFEAGQSNPTYLLLSEYKNFVLRSKPTGKLLPGAHRIDREFKVMTSLESSTIPVPKIFGYCQNEDLIGSEFYIMEYLEGNHEFDPLLPNYEVDQRDKIYKHKIKILAELASLNLNKVGLEKFGRPEGYLERQINLWIKQYRDSQTKDIESMEFLIENIPRNIPEEISILPPCLLHGDFRLDNMIIKKDNGFEKIIGLLDWELSTLSPPFIDLSYWILMLKFEKDWPIAGIGNYNKSLAKSGIPAEETILETFLNMTGLDRPKYWKYLLAFNSFRFAGILQGIAKRVINGNNAGNNGYEVGEQAEPVAKLGAKILKEYL